MAQLQWKVTFSFGRKPFLDVSTAATKLAWLYFLGIAGDRLLLDRSLVGGLAGMNEIAGLDR